MTRTLIRIPLVIALVALLLTFTASAAPGDLDPTFGGGDGFVYQAFASEFSNGGTAVDLQPDGKIIVGGYTDSAGVPTMVARFNTDGTLDTTFGTNGYTFIPDSGSLTSITDLVVLGDGSIVVVGGVNNQYAFISKLTANGAIDTTFGTNGTSTFQVTDAKDTTFNALTPSSGGGFIVVGEVDFDRAFDFLIVKYDADGTINTTFGGGDGHVVTDYGTYEFARDVIEEADGKIVVAGDKTQLGFGFVLARHNADGTPDTTFGGGDGFVINDFRQQHTAGTLLPAGTDGYLLVGSLGRFVGLVQYTNTGALDTSFGGGDGYVQHEYNRDTVFISAGAYLPNGDIALVGNFRALNNNFADIFVTSFKPNGNLDTNFGGGDGYVTVGEEFPDRAEDVVIQPDGKIVAVGVAQVPQGNFKAFVGRFDGVATRDEGSLLYNGGFEDGDSFWKIKGKTMKGDKVKGNKIDRPNGKPDKIFSYEGDAAFRFKGQTKENTRLQQRVDLNGLSFSNGDLLTFSAYVDASGPSVGKVKIVVKYTDATPKSKLNLDLVSTVDGYELLTGTVTVDSANVDKIKVIMRHRGQTGKTYVDSVRLEQASGLLPPLPPAPDGFRG